MYRICVLTLWFVLSYGIEAALSASAQSGFSPVLLGLHETDAATCKVTNTDNEGAGTLRHCITVANSAPGTTVEFTITTAPNAHDGLGNSWWRITALSPLPPLTADGTVIDGTTQSGNTNGKGPEIEINGASSPDGTDGLTIANAKGVTLRGLVVSGFKTGRGIVITGSGAGGNRVQGNYIGTNPTGTKAVGNYDGIAITHAGAANIVGGTAAGEGNIISGNRREGIWISDTPNSVIQGNYIGARPDNSALPNGIDGIRLQDASGTVIGGAAGGARNVIPARNYMAGCRTSPGLLLNTSVNEAPVEVLGSVVAFALLVNTRVVDLPGGDSYIQGNGIDEVIEMKGGELESPIMFHLEMTSPETVSSWALNILDLQGNILQSIEGLGPPPAELPWDGRSDQNMGPIDGGLYLYQLVADHRDGTHVASPVRLLSAVRTSAVSIILGSGAFLPDSAELSGRSKRLLKEAAAALRKYPREQIVIEGHADSAGSERLNLELAQKRTSSIVSFLINEEKIPAEKIIALSPKAGATITARNTAVMEKSDGRVEVKGEFSDEGRREILDQHRTVPHVRINDAAIPIDDLGRFSHAIEKKCDHIELDMRDEQGRAVQTLLPLPAVDLHVPCREMYVPLAQEAGPAGDVPRTRDNSGKAGVAKARHSVKGTTEAGNTLRMNGNDVNVAQDGTFILSLDVTEGENVYALELTNPAGYSRYITLIVRATLEKSRKRPGKGDEESPPFNVVQGIDR